MLVDKTPVLLVEDDANDVLLMKIAWESDGIKNTLKVIPDGKQALAYLGGTGKYANRARFPLPYLLLLDLKLPHVMGLEVLKWIRQRPELVPTIVLILSSSADPADINAAYRSGANGYLVKPSSLEKLRVLARSVKEFWLRHNQPSPEAFGGNN